MPGIESSIVAHDEAVEQRHVAAVPAPAWMRPPGRNWKSCKMSKNFSSHTGASILLNSSQRVGDAAPGIANGAVGMARSAYRYFVSQM